MQSARRTGRANPGVSAGGQGFYDPKNRRLDRSEELAKYFYTRNLGKILSRVIVNRIEPLADTVLSNSQFGFRKHMSTTQAIVALTLIQQKANEQATEMWGLFIDIEKEFDSPS